MNDLSTGDFESPRQHWVSTFLPWKIRGKARAAARPAVSWGVFSKQHGFYPTQALDMAESRLACAVSKKSVPGFARSLAAIFSTHQQFFEGSFWDGARAKARPKRQRVARAVAKAPWFHGYSMAFGDVTIADISRKCVFSCFNCSPLLGCVNQLFRRLEFRKTTKPTIWPRLPVDATGEDSHQKFRSLADPTT